MRRRTFLKWSVKAGLITAVSMAGWGCSRESKDGSQAIRLPPLPYGFDALEPYISEETLRFHYGKHHRGYVDKTNRLLRDTSMQKQPLVNILLNSYQAKSCEQNAVFNNAAQVYNHTFYWNSMKPNGGGKPVGLMAERINKSFGGYDTFRETFTKAAIERFASGWTWLVLKEGALAAVNTANAVTPFVQNMRPLLVIDVWEHAYYLDYHNRRDAYVEAFLDHLINWEFAAANMGEA